jgi:hypothetical protein
VVRETRWSPDMCITFGAGNSFVREGARGARHKITAGLVTARCGVSYARFVTFVVYVSLLHGTRQVCDHMIMSFDIIIESLMPLEHCLHTPGFHRQLSYSR